MIKHCSFTFAEVDSQNHWVDFACFGEQLDFEEEYFDTYQDALGFHLDPEKCYQLGFDQSSSNTGIFIKDFKNTEAHMVEVSRNKYQDASQYIFDLEMFLNQLTNGCTISHTIYERPIKTESYRSTQVAFQLEGAIQGFSRRYSQFKASSIDNIENQAWRASVIDKQLSGVYGRKELSRVSINHIFPWTTQYGFSLSKDNDIFEAMGVLFGWFMASFDPLGRPYVRGDRTSRTIGGFLLPGLSGEKVKAMLDEEGIPARLLIENPRYSICQNIASAVSDDYTACVEITRPYTMLSLCIESNIKWMNPPVCTALLTDAARVNPKLNAIAGGEFHFVL